MQGGMQPYSRRAYSATGSDGACTHARAQAWATMHRRWCPCRRR